MRFTGLSLSQTPPRTSSSFLQPQLVTTTKQGVQRASSRVTSSCYCLRVPGDSAVRAHLSPSAACHSTEEDRISQEEARRAHEAQLAVIQREAARERAAAEEHFVGLIDRVSQMTDAQFQQMQ